MFKSLFMSLAMVATVATASAQTYYVVGNGEKWEGKQYELPSFYPNNIAEIYPDFYITDGTDTWGAPENHSVIADGDEVICVKGSTTGFTFADGVSYFTDGDLEFFGSTGKLVFYGTPVTGEGPSKPTVGHLYVLATSGSVEGSNELNQEPGTQIYTGTITLAGDKPEWKLSTTADGTDATIYAMPAPAESENVTSGSLFSVGTFAVPTAAGTYEVFFNAAIGTFTLSLKEANKVVFNFSPAQGSTVEKFPYVSLTITGSNNVMLSPEYYSEDNAGGVYDAENNKIAAISFVPMGPAQFSVNFSMVIETAGTYTLVLPKGTFTFDGVESEEQKATYHVVPVGDSQVTFTPNPAPNAKVTSIKTITLTPSTEVSTLTLNPSSSSKVALFSGNVYVGLDQAAPIDYFRAIVNDDHTVTLVLGREYVAEGNPSIMIPAGMFLIDGAKNTEQIFRYVIEGESSISAIEAAGSASQQIFDLSGRRLSAPVRGINIINGRKVVVK